MIQIKTLIKGGQPAFEVRRYAPNFKSSVLLLETNDYNDAVEVKNFLDARTVINPTVPDPNQLTIDVPQTPSRNGK